MRFVTPLTEPKASVCVSHNWFSGEPSPPFQSELVLTVEPGPLI